MLREVRLLDHLIERVHRQLIEQRRKESGWGQRNERQTVRGGLPDAVHWISEEAIWAGCRELSRRVAREEIAVIVRIEANDADGPDVDNRACERE